MNEQETTPSDKRYGSPPEIVAHAAWLDFRFALRHRDVDGVLAAHFRPRRHHLTAAAYRQTRTDHCAIWRAVTGTPAMA